MMEKFVVLFESDDVVTATANEESGTRKAADKHCNEVLNSSEHSCTKS